MVGDSSLNTPPQLTRRPAACACLTGPPLVPVLTPIPPVFPAVVMPSSTTHSCPPRLPQS